MRLIDADVAIEELTDRSHQAAKRVGTDSPFWEGLVIARHIVNNLPTIQPERKKGEWIEISSINHTYKCSECGRLLVNVTDGKNNVSKHYPYCHCGAKMKGADT